MAAFADETAAVNFVCIAMYNVAGYVGYPIGLNDCEKTAWT